MDPDSIPQNLNFITLNIQQIELLNIATSQTINELLLTTNQIRNLIPEEVKRVIEKNTDINIIINEVRRALCASASESSD